MSARRILALAVLLALCLPAVATAQEPDQLNDERARLRAAMHAEASLLRQLYAIEDIQFKHERNLAGIRARQAAIRTKIEQDRAMVARMQLELPQQGRRLGRRMALLYRLGRGGFWKLLMTSDSFADFVRRYRALKRVVQLDAQLLAVHRTELVALRDRQQNLWQQEAQLAALAESERLAAQEVDIEKRKKMFMLEEIQRDKQLALRLTREMEQQDSALAQQIAGLALSPRAPGEPLRLDFAQRRGYLPRPVPGPIVGQFGVRVHSRFGTQTRSNGIDIQAPAGTPVRVVADGIVRYVGEFVGYGRMVIVEHGERYYTLYAHLANFLVNRGDLVHEGTALGLIGSSGMYEQPILHFEIRRQGTAINPTDWLGLAP